MLPIKIVECPKEKYKTKCPHTMNPTRIVIHNTENDAPAANEISYMLSRPGEISFHFAVDDKEAVQGIPLDRNAWHAGDGNGKGNREGIAIEICYSRSGGERFAAAVDNAAQLTAQLLSERGWGLDRVTKHQDYSGKHCPRRILDEYGWNNFLLLVDNYLIGEQQKREPETAPQVIYAAHTIGGKWLPDVVDCNDVNADGYAGIVGKSIDGVRAKPTQGSILYRVHTKGSKNYLPWVRDLDAREGGYAGIYGRAIDGIQMKLENLPGYTVRYRVSTVGGGYLPWVTGCNDVGSDGYAGIYGKPIDKIQIKIIKE